VADQYQPGGTRTGTAWFAPAVTVTEVIDPDAGPMATLVIDVVARA
jgi:hypothetical protein